MTGWLRDRGRASRIGIAALFTVAVCGSIGLLMGAVKAHWPDAQSFAMVGGMLLGMPVGSVSVWYCIGLMFEGRVKPWR